MLAHLAIRRFAPYADPAAAAGRGPAQRPGPGLIHRLDLVPGVTRRSERRTARCCGRSSASSVSRQWSSSDRSPNAGPLRLHLRRRRPGVTRHPGLLPARLSETKRGEDLDSLPGFSIQPAEFSRSCCWSSLPGCWWPNAACSPAATHFWAWICPAREIRPSAGGLDHLGGVMVFEKDLGTSLLLTDRSW